jgi:hypothetical protein
VRQLVALTGTEKVSSVGTKRVETRRPQYNNINVGTERVGSPRDTQRGA